MGTDYIHKLKKLRHNLYIQYCCKLPIQNNKILMWANSFKQYGCNPKYITEELLKNYPGKYEIVWVFDTGVELPHELCDRVRIVRYFSMEYLRELHTAHFIICNMRTNKSYMWKKRKGQIYIQTWHSSLRLKMIEGDAETLSPNYVEAAKADSEKIDLLISGCDFSTDTFRRAFWYDGPILKSGTPRCDMLIGEHVAFREKVRSCYNLISDQKLVLYAPTFRDRNQDQTHGMDFYKLRSALEKKFNGTWSAGCRLHPNIQKDVVAPGSISMTAYPDMQELIAASDCLITDYSSCMFDMAIAGKPCILYVPDLDVYMKNERGLYFYIEDLPFPIARTMTELYRVIADFDENSYRENVAAFMKKIGSYEDGNAAKRIVDYIELCSKGSLEENR